MSKKAEQILDRYLKNYVTDEQLDKYLSVGAITKEEFEIIKASK